MARSPGRVTHEGVLPNDWAFVYFDGKRWSAGGPIELVSA